MRNFQILEPLDFLAEFTQHIPPKGSHLIRYYGWYSNKSRGIRKKATAVASAEAPAEPPREEAASHRSSQAWAMLIKRVYEVDPMCCPECGGQMQVVSFIEPPQADVIEAILKHCAAIWFKADGGDWDWSADFDFKWGNGPAAADWHTHWYPAGRYAYDIVAVDEKNGELKPGTDGKKNEDSLSWDAEIRSASAGTVVFVHDTEDDHLPDLHYILGSLPVPVWPGTANVIVVQDGNTRHLYAHVKKGTAGVAVGVAVTAGQVIGRIGNNGQSSGPHLH